MQRTELLAKLTAVSPALADSNLIPVMTHFWFTGDEVMAFNDQIAMAAPCKTEMVGAVPGSVLLALLKNSKALAIDFLPKDKFLHIAVAGKGSKPTSQWKLGMLPPESFVFDMPESKGKSLPLKSRNQFLDCIDTCMRSVGADTSVPDQLGITLIPERKGEIDTLAAYATNNSTLSYAKIQLTGPVPFKGRVILPSAFCSQMLSMTTGKNPLHLEIHRDYAYCEVGTTRLFGRLIESDQPVDFADVLEHHFPVSKMKTLIPIPSKLQLILERAIVITDAASDQGSTQITVRDGVMKFLSKTDRGEVADEMQIGEQHPDVQVRLEPKRVKNGYGFFDKMVVTDRCVVMTKDHMIYLVSAHGN